MRYGLKVWMGGRGGSRPKTINRLKSKENKIFPIGYYIVQVHAIGCYILNKSAQMSRKCAKKTEIFF